MRDAVLAIHALGGFFYSFDRSINQFHFVRNGTTTAEKTVCGTSAIKPASNPFMPKAEHICGTY